MYQLTKYQDVIKRIVDGAFIPAKIGNSDYKKYLEWVAAGNTAQSRDPQEIADEQAQEAIALKNGQDAAAAKGYAKLQALAAMTPAQVQAWVAANVNNLADAKDAITTLAVGFSVLARRI